METRTFEIICAPAVAHMSIFLHGTHVMACHSGIFKVRMSFVKGESTCQSPDFMMIHGFFCSIPTHPFLPGYCSPSMNLAFTDIPNGLKGAATVPLAGNPGGVKACHLLELADDV